MSEDSYIMAESALNYEPKNIFLTGGAGAYSFLSDIDIELCSFLLLEDRQRRLESI